MSINLRDKITFLFKGGRGVTPDQVNWDDPDTMLDDKVQAEIDKNVIVLAPTVARPAATEAHYLAGTRLIQGPDEYYAVQSGHTATRESWTWGYFDDTDMPSGMRYRGVVGPDPIIITSPLVDDWVYQYTSGRWYRRVSTTSWQSQSGPPAGVNFDSHYRSVQAAQNAGLTTVGTVIYTNGGLEIIRAYTGATPDTIGYDWHTIGAHLTGSGSVVLQGNVITWDASQLSAADLAQLVSTLDTSGLATDAEATAIRTALNAMLTMVESEATANDGRLDTLEQRRITQLPNPTTPGGFVHWNGAGTDFDVEQIISSIPHVADIPDVTVASPPAIFLDFDVYDGGVREDATFTPGELGTFFGFSSGLDGTPAIGSISKASPISKILCGGTYSPRAWTIDFIYSPNRAWLDSFDMVRIDGAEYTMAASQPGGSQYYRQVQNGPTLNGDAATLNKRRADSSYYFVTSESILQHEKGLYVIKDGEYRILDPSSSIHSTGIGPPTGQPERGDATYHNGQGQFWTSRGAIVRVQTAATATAVNWAHPQYVVYPADRTVIFDNGDGSFWPDHDGGDDFLLFEQRQGPVIATDYQYNRSWEQVMTYITANDGSATPTQQAENDRLLAEVTFLGREDTEMRAAAVADLLLPESVTTVADDTLLYYDTTSNERRLRMLRNVNRSVRLVHNGLSWHGPHFVEADVKAWLASHMVFNSGDVATERLENIKRDGTTYNILSPAQRHHLDQVPDLLLKTQELTVTDQRTWVDATAAQGAVLTFAAQPDAAALTGATWAAPAATASETPREPWIAVRLPVAADPTYYEVRETNSAGSPPQDVHLSNFILVTTDSDYAYYIWGAYIRTTSTFTLRFDERRTTRYQGHAFEAITEAAYQALAIKDAATFYFRTP